MAAIAFTLELGLYGANYKALIGARWRASFYDSEREQFYAGSADCPWEAIGWALHEREQRVANDGHPTVTKSGLETPVQALARLRSTTSAKPVSFTRTSPPPRAPEPARPRPRTATARSTRRP